MSESSGRGDPLYLFFCYLEWHRRNNLAAYYELLAALDDSDPDIRTAAEVLLRQASPAVKAAITAAERG